MTVGQLEKLLSKVKNKRMRVFVDKPTLWDGNDTFNICSISSAEETVVDLVDGDGFNQYTKKGVMRQDVRFVLSGER